MSGHKHGDHSHCNHDDDEHQKLDGALEFLYDRIDLEHSIVMNGADGSVAKNAIKPWDARVDESAYIESDADETLIVKVLFTGNVKLRSLLIKSGPGGQTASTVKLFRNQDLDFDECEEMQETQAFDVPVTRDAVEYALRLSKWPSTSSLTMYFPASHGDETTRVYFIGFRGEYSKFTRDPVITAYEAQANPADHKKVPGLENVMRGVQ